RFHYRGDGFVVVNPAVDSPRLRTSGADRGAAFWRRWLAAIRERSQLPESPVEVAHGFWVRRRGRRSGSHLDTEPPSHSGAPAVDAAGPGIGSGATRHGVRYRR